MYLHVHIQLMLNNPNTCVVRLGFGLSNGSDYQAVNIGLHPFLWFIERFRLSSVDCILLYMHRSSYPFPLFSHILGLLSGQQPPLSKSLKNSIWKMFPRFLPLFSFFPALLWRVCLLTKQRQRTKEKTFSQLTRLDICSRSQSDMEQGDFFNWKSRLKKGELPEIACK